MHHTNFTPFLSFVSPPQIAPRRFPISPHSLAHITYACCFHTGCHDLVCACAYVHCVRVCVGVYMRVHACATSSHR